MADINTLARIVLACEDLPDVFCVLHSRGSLSGSQVKPRLVVCGYAMRGAIEGAGSAEKSSRAANSRGSRYGATVPGGGVEAMALRPTLGSQGVRAILACDGRNAFNSMSRSEILPAVGECSAEPRRVNQ